MKIEFYKHNLNSEDKREVSKVLNSLFLTTGEWVSKFEKAFAKFLNLPHVVGVTSCTEALYLSLKNLGVGPGDEVVTTPLSFISTANAVEYCGAKPIFVDVEPETGNIDVDLVEKSISKKTKALLVVHLYGQLCDMKKISKIAKKHRIKVIEDAAHCIEGSRDGVRVGELGDLACFSFYATKNITSGEGGAISCHNIKTYEWLKKARLHGMSKDAAERYSKKYKHWDMEFLGFKMNMNNIQAALLINQLKRIEKLRRVKERIAKLYKVGFSGNPKIKIPSVMPNAKHARLLFTIWVDPKKRDNLLHSLQDLGIGVAVNFRPVHLLKYYRQRYGYKTGDFPVAERIGASTISLPFYPKLRKKEVNYIIKTVNRLTSSG
ncbi:hypothetical protein A2115_03120 [Candidatus Woesebacteria bacterium GWA1_41_8]|uniref:UDP-4-amino-4, 6-dideoxy-N-acetyl-beta-L-altrosamine transaminase n=1 Tax=Candidatus Woesebacteria bacterium GWA1_41_8 TaxID=1802471 RepID=A0A1F7WIN6_9BACT|nr:MAG: hypothetical protein A2115_03120 [Candidatus Woesebacteria bacterium GWA1_41_8]